ncbi:sensor histidine kinase [Peredibacter starrii]|uniref:histidine kinase n=1 Tax=Peredibacter starrii TaxID=28202 RepID=A0AAX4HKD2_9BACT|nr:HAMP domain-containing sensor histidine kinase [Peredibacter starrii]WPU63668.1 HAMP domain-containing sensor histidine kinase [Peredibacter starrii]
MVGWIWPIRGFKLFLQDISGTELWGRWRYMLLAGMAFVSVALASYGFGFTSYTLPFTLGVVVCGLSMVFEALKKSHVKETPLHWCAYVFTALYFFTRLAFPIWRMESLNEPMALVVDLFFYVIFAGITSFITLEMVKFRHDEEVDHLLKERNDRLLGQSKYAELGMMSAGIAHEINNPLAVIQARTTQLLRIHQNPEKQKDLGDGLQQILHTSERINRTIQGVREFIHQDEKGPQTDVDLKTLVDDVLAFCGQRMKNHGINLRFYGLENYSVVGNKIQLEQVILNLLNNSFDAIEYLPDKWIEISAQQSNDHVQIFVKDSGPGIPPEIAARIMEPFYSTKDLGKGTGLGLALARGIVEKHGGTLIYLEETSHTTFLIDLPAEPHTDWGISTYH